jgi:hypothetical protein
MTKAEVMINQALRAYIEGHQPALEDIIRRVVREELSHYKPDENSPSE